MITADPDETKAGEAAEAIPGRGGSRALKRFIRAEEAAACAVYPAASVTGETIGVFRAVKISGKIIG